MERLVRIYEEETGVHPLIRSAWLHHSFIQIHPFEDGNGRVARAITLLVTIGYRTRAIREAGLPLGDELCALRSDQ